MLILASTSSIRRQMLDCAGVEYKSLSPGIDEEQLKAALTEPVDIAPQLAAAKALSVAGDEWVIGSDSVVHVGEHVFSKPSSREEAARHLRYFSGKTMHLTSAVALARNGRIDWSCTKSARLEVRQLSDAFIKAYLDCEWPAVGFTVGAFRLEGRGVQLFSEIEGDHFTILGMPLIPLLSALRERGVLQS